MTETPEATLARLNAVVERLEEIVPQVTEALKQHPITMGGHENA